MIYTLFSIAAWWTGIGHMQDWDGSHATMSFIPAHNHKQQVQKANQSELDLCKVLYSLQKDEIQRSHAKGLIVRIVKEDLTGKQRLRVHIYLYSSYIWTQYKTSTQLKENTGFLLVKSLPYAFRLGSESYPWWAWQVCYQIPWPLLNFYFLSIKCCIALAYFSLSNNPTYFSCIHQYLLTSFDLYAYTRGWGRAILH